MLNVVATLSYDSATQTMTIATFPNEYTDEYNEVGFELMGSSHGDTSTSSEWTKITEWYASNGIGTKVYDLQSVSYAYVIVVRKLKQFDGSTMVPYYRGSNLLTSTLSNSVYSTQSLEIASLGSTPSDINVTANFDLKAGMSADLQTTIIHNVSANYAITSGMTVDATLGQAIEPLNVTATYDIQLGMKAEIYLFDPILRTISGQVTMSGSPFSNAKVYVMTDDGSKIWLTYSDSSGNYSVTIDNAGEYHIMVVAEDVLNNVYTSISKPYINISQ